MQKIIALVLSINLILFNTLPAWAGRGGEIIRILPRIANPAAETIARTASTATTRSALSAAEYAALYEMALPQNQAALLQKAQTNEFPELNLALKRASAQAALTHAIDTSLLKETGLTRLQEAPQAVSIWKKDLVQLADKMAKNPALFTTEQLVKPSNQAYADVLGHFVTDISAIGIFGTASHDAQALLNAYQTVAHTPAAGVVAAAAARALLRLKAYPELAQLAKQTPAYTHLWNGIGKFAKERNLPLQIEPLGKSNFSLAYAPVLYQYGRLTANAAEPSYRGTAWYMDLGIANLAKQAKARKTAAPKKETVPPLQVAQVAQVAQPAQAAQPAKIANTVPLNISLSIPSMPGTPQAAIRPPLLAPVQTPKPLPNIEEQFGGEERFSQMMQQARTFLESPEYKHRLSENLKDKSTFFQRASLYLASFAIGLEIGTPIMASLGGALGLSIEENILVTAATYLPYSIGSFFTNWLMGKIGRKTAVNIGLGLMGGAFLTGATLLGLDGNFAPWLDRLTHYWSILGAITIASFGGVFIHNAAGPIMTDVSKHATDLVRQKRGTFIELARAGGMLSSFAFPFIATSMLMLDWSAPFLMALPFVGGAALALNLAKIPNSKPVVKAVATLEKAKTNWLAALKDNQYVRLFKEDKSVAPLLSGLFLMNGVEMAYNSGFLLLLPSLTSNPSSQYLFGLTQFALPFLLGRYLAGKFLEWFPKHNLSVATAIAALGGSAAAGLSHNVYSLTAALFTAEMGISTAFTLAFARTAKNTATQDRITSLIIASAVACAIGPVSLTAIAQRLIDAGVFSLEDATAFALIGIPSLLAAFSTGLFQKAERLVSGTFSEGTSSLLKKLRNILPRHNTPSKE